jgi:hypothetical protein
MLVLFFNLVCLAAPVLELTPENNKESVSIQLVHIPTPLENEEENHAASSGYTNHVTFLSLRKQCTRQINHQVGGTMATSAFAIDLPEVHLNDACVLPPPGYYSFLFLYNLF